MSAAGDEFFERLRAHLHQAPSRSVEAVLIFVKLLESTVKIEEPVRAELRARQGLELLEELLKKAPDNQEALALKVTLLVRVAGHS